MRQHERGAGRVFRESEELLLLPDDPVVTRARLLHRTLPLAQLLALGESDPKYALELRCGAALCTLCSYPRRAPVSTGAGLQRKRLQELHVGNVRSLADVDEVAAAVRRDGGVCALSSRHRLECVVAERVAFEHLHRGREREVNTLERVARRHCGTDQLLERSKVLWRHSRAI